MLSLLVELQRLKGLDRTGWTLRGLPGGSESVASHSFGVAATAMLFADELVSRGVNLDVERILRIALLHDAAEVRVGDMPRTASKYYGADVRRQAETAAFGDMIASLADESRILYSSLHEEYENRSSLESRIVKAADLIDLIVQVLAFERTGARGLNEFWEGVASQDCGLEGIAGEAFNELVQQICSERERVLGTATKHGIHES
jgi:putative hydrolase of HD superfamily